MTSYYCDGMCCLHYDNGDVEQSVDLHTVKWCYAGHCWKSYRADKPNNAQLSALKRAAAAEPKACSLHFIK